LEVAWVAGVQGQLVGDGHSRDHRVIRPCVGLSTDAPRPHRRVTAGSRPRPAGGGLGGSRDRDRPRPAVQRSADGLYVGGLEEASWVEISDSRLDGRITIATSATNDGLGPTLDSDVISNAYRIVTTEGAWVGQPSAWFWLEDETISETRY
jgi:hypothetical protein